MLSYSIIVDFSMTKVGKEGEMTMTHEDSTHALADALVKGLAVATCNVFEIKGIDIMKFSNDEWKEITQAIKNEASGQRFDEMMADCRSMQSNDAAVNQIVSVYCIESVTVALKKLGYV